MAQERVIPSQELWEIYQEAFRIYDDLVKKKEMESMFRESFVPAMFHELVKNRRLTPAR